MRANRPVPLFSFSLFLFVDSFTSRLNPLTLYSRITSSIIEVVEADLVYWKFYECIWSHLLMINELRRQFFGRNTLVDVIRVTSVPSFSFCLKVFLTYFLGYSLLCARASLIKMLPDVTIVLISLFLNFSNDYNPTALRGLCDSIRRQDVRRDPVMGQIVNFRRAKILI